MAEDHFGQRCLDNVINKPDEEDGDESHVIVFIVAH